MCMRAKMKMGQEYGWGWLPNGDWRSPSLVFRGWPPIEVETSSVEYFNSNSLAFLLLFPQSAFLGWPTSNATEYATFFRSHIHSVDIYVNQYDA